jgi:hypothetical protein
VSLLIVNDQGEGLQLAARATELFLKPGDLGFDLHHQVLDPLLFCLLGMRPRPLRGRFCMGEKRRYVLCHTVIAHGVPRIQPQRSFKT